MQHQASPAVARPSCQTLGRMSRSGAAVVQFLREHEVTASCSALMNPDRIFDSNAFFRPTTEAEPIRSVVTQSAEAVVVAWCVLPGQRIAAHVHPHGQDTWTILSGQGEYQLHSDGTARPVRAGNIVVAPTGCVHGVLNAGGEPLRIISVVSPAEAGYQLL